MVNEILRLTAKALLDTPSDEDSEKQREEFLKELALHLKRVVDSESTCDSQPNDLLITRVCAYVESNIGSAIRLNDISDAVGMSPSHFSREFKRQTDMTPMEFVMLRRCSAAKLLLKSTTMPLTDIAMRCGFASPSHFTTAFKDVVGTTPSKFRDGVT